MVSNAKSTFCNIGRSLNTISIPLTSCFHVFPSILPSTLAIQILNNYLWAFCVGYVPFGHLSWATQVHVHMGPNLRRACSNLNDQEFLTRGDVVKRGRLIGRKRGLLSGAEARRKPVLLVSFYHSVISRVVSKQALIVARPSTISTSGLSYGISSTPKRGYQSVHTWRNHATGDVGSVLRFSI